MTGKDKEALLEIVEQARGASAPELKLLESKEYLQGYRFCFVQLEAAIQAFVEDPRKEGRRLLHEKEKLLDHG